VLAAAGVIVAAVAVFGFVSLLLVAGQLHGSLDDGLRQRARTVAELAVTDPAILATPGALESPVSGRQIDVEVLDAHGRILARSLNLGADLLPLVPVARGALRLGRAGFAQVTLSGQQFRLYAAPIPDAYGPAAAGVVLVASETSDITHTLHHLAATLITAGAIIALLALLLAGVLTRRGIQPLRRLALAAERIEQTADPAQRLPQAEASDEIGQLTGTLNRMLASLQRAREGERRFLADASHELRTPVTALRGNIEYAIRHGADEEVLADLHGDAVRLARLVDNLLVLEREGGAAPDSSQVAIVPLVEAVAAEYPEVVVDRRADERLAVAGDADALARALRNLIENGLGHGRGTVSVTIAGENGRAQVTVRDEGPGVADPDRAFERFWRGPDAGGQAGSGLGLSIVAAIVARHGGTIAVDHAAFTLELPTLDAGD
jgi:signal transduction histidine kinase